jgi:hypothetical protein
MKLTKKYILIIYLEILVIHIQKRKKKKYNAQIL